MKSNSALFAHAAIHLPRYLGIYSRYSKWTMISRSTFVRNLALVHQFSGVDGAIVECGVWRGGMMAGIASVLGANRHYHLFDSFEGLPKAKEIDGKGALEWQANTTSPDYYDNCRAEESHAIRAMTLAGAKNYELHKGWFDQTVPLWKNLSSPIAVLRLDCDWYESMNVCLRTLVPHLAKGGVIIVDDYYAWDGCARAVHEYLASAEKTFRMRQFFNGPFFIVNE